MDSYVSKCSKLSYKLLQPIDILHYVTSAILLCTKNSQRCVCSPIQVSSSNEKLSEVTTAVVEVLQDSCGECVSEIVIDSQFFACYPESPSHVTYRARLEATSERESGSLISLIEEWVRGGASVIVTGVLMTVDPDCSVAISSLSEGECSPNVAGDKKSDDGGNTAAIITGAVVALFVIALIVAVVVIVFLVLKNRRRELLSSKSDTKFVYFYVMVCFSILFPLNRDTAVEMSAVTLGSNKAYWKVKAAEKADEYEATGIPSSPPPLPPAPPAAVDQSGETAYDFIPGDQ